MIGVRDAVSDSLLAFVIALTQKKGNGDGEMQLCGTVHGSLLQDKVRSRNK